MFDLINGSVTRPYADWTAEIGNYRCNTSSTIVLEVILETGATICNHTKSVSPIFTDKTIQLA